MLDVDGDGQVLPHTDGLMILRRMLGLSGVALTNAAYNPLGTRPGDTPTHRTDIQNFIDALFTNAMTDIDGNGVSTSAITDGVLLLRALSGYGGSAVTAAAISGSPPATRQTWGAIYDYLSGTCGITTLAPRSTP